MDDNDNAYERDTKESAHLSLKDYTKSVLTDISVSLRKERERMNKKDRKNCDHFLRNTDVSAE